MIDTKNIQQAKNQIKKEKSPIIVKAQDLEFNRKIIETNKIDILLFDKFGHGKDKLKKADSSLDYIIAKIAAENGVTIAFDLASMRKSDRKTKAVLLTKIMQDIKTCKRKKCRIGLFSVKDEKDAKNLMLSLGASTKQAKQSITF